MDVENLKRQIVDVFIANDVLMSTELLERLGDEKSVEKIHGFVSSNPSTTQLLDLNSNCSTFLSQEATTVVLPPKEEAQPQEDTKVRVVYAPEVTEKKRLMEDFVIHLRKRYEALQAMLLQRRELQEKTISVSRVNGKKERDTVAVICMIKDKRETKNGNLLFEVEDLTGTTNVLVNKTKADLFAKAKDMVLDEVVGVIGKNGDNIIFADDVIFPDIPLHGEIKKFPEEAYTVFLSDVHIGSYNFLKDEFEKMLKWLRGEVGGDKHREMAKKVKYLFVTGDFVDGVGVYPNQDEELEIKDIYAQYAKAAEYLEQVPSHIQIIICPGNHDAMRLGEPQPRLYEDLAKPLYDLPNVTIVPNPAVVNIHAVNGFPGFNVLMYHGYSYIYYGDKVDSLHEKGGIDRTDLIMRYLLQKRHLAPTHGSALFIPEITEDQLVIKHVPDIFVSGHVHKASASEYRGVTMICSSCWQSITDFEEKLGLHPEPARLPVHSLHTRKTILIKFGSD